MLNKLLVFLGIREEDPLNKFFIFGGPYTSEDWKNINAGRGPISGSGFGGIFYGRHLAAKSWACQIKGCQRPSQHTITTTAALDVDLTPFIQEDRLRGVSVLPTYRWYHICDHHLHDYYKGGNKTPAIIESDGRAREIIDIATRKEVVYQEG